VARDIGIDRLLGGTQVKAVLEILAGSAVHYLPFPGAPFEHPAKLAGSPVARGFRRIVRSASEMSAVAAESGARSLQPAADQRLTWQSIGKERKAGRMARDAQKMRAVPLNFQLNLQL
jgi:hypothetical protein